MVFLLQGGVVFGGVVCLWFIFIFEIEVYLDLVIEVRVYSRMGVGLWFFKLGGIGLLQCFFLFFKDRDLFLKGIVFFK